MRPEFTRLHFPARWYFDILRCLDALRDAGVPFDARMQDALNVLAERRRPDGRWVVNRAYPGETHVPPPPAGQPDRWVTLIALRVLGRFDSCAGPRGDLTCHPSHLHDLDQLSQPSEVRGVAGDQRQPFG